MATLQVCLKNRTGFLISRLALGFAEAGYIPGAVYTLSTWYTRRELAKRVAVLFFGMFGGNAISPLLASGILKLDNARGLRGWQWLFLRMFYGLLGPPSSISVMFRPINTDILTVEGLFTILVSFFLLLFLPGSPDTPRPLIGRGLVRFTAEEQDTLQTRLEKDDTGKRPGAQGLPIDWKLVWRTVSHYRRWPHYVSTFAVFSTWAPLTTYTPTIIM